MDPEWKDWPATALDPDPVPREPAPDPEDDWTTEAD